MSRILEVSQRLSGLLADAAFVIEDSKPPFMVVRDWVFFAEEYISAASLLDSQLHERQFARMQVSGQAVECALKAYISTTGHPIPKHHDLVALCDLAETSGCHITEMHAVAIFQLSLHFYQDVGTGTKFKARYPVSRYESSRQPIPEHTVVKDLTDSICAKALANVPPPGT
jgi:HEPN domain-containing protein